MSRLRARYRARNTGVGVASFVGALDSYPADAAYSVYRLFSSYTGSLLRVRRSSDNTEQDIGYDDNGYLDTASLLAFVGAGDGFVVTWYDQSGNGLDASQTTAANQPQIVSGGSLATENSIAALDYNGSSSLLNISVPITSGFSVFGVYKTTKPNSYLIGSDPELGRRSSNQWRFRSSTGFSAGANGGTHPDTQVIITGIEDGVNATVYGNGTQQGQVASTFVSATLTQMGKGYPLGNYQTVIIYNSEQNSNRTGIETAINNLFSVY